MRYNRKIFRFNSTKARQKMLLRDAVFHGDQMLVLDCYNGFNRPHKQCDVEHVVPLRMAWDSGFEQQYQDNPDLARENMKAFSNDLDNLIFAGSSPNRQRGYKSLWMWSPLNLAFIPVRNEKLRLIFDRYGLKLTKPQQWALEWSDRKLKGKYKHGIVLSKTRAWLIEHGFHRALMPF